MNRTIKFFTSLLLWLFSHLFFCVNADAQNAISADLFRVPTSNFSKAKASFDQINPFTGVNSVSIPVYEINERGLQVPISLNYSSGGIMVNDNPGFVGLSWNLQAGGMITRKVNNIPDESCGGQLWGPDGYFSYYLTFRDEDVYIQYYGPYATYSAGYFFNTAASPGSTPYPKQDSNPDEFYFNVNGISGSFFMGIDGQWKVKSDAGNSLKIRSTYGTLPGVFITIKEFEVIDQNGVIYTFGGDQSSIERTKNVVQYSSFLMSYATYFSDFNSQSVTGLPIERETLESFPSVWHLKKIESPEGAEIIFNYLQPGTKSSSSNSYVKNRNSIGIDESGTWSLTKPSYLTSIETENQRINFNRSVENAYHQAFNSTGSFEHNYNPDGYYKLDNIEVVSKTSNEILKKIRLGYREVPTERLKLKTISTESNGIQEENFSFTYNSNLLQNYYSNTDHWGFNTLRPRAPVTNITDYFNSREPDLTACQAELLMSVKSAYGGTTSFEYEPNSYSKVAKHYPFVIDSYIGSGGGVRVRKIINDPLIGESIEKEYYYVSSGFSAENTSSGVLSGIPKYDFQEPAPNSQSVTSFQSSMVNTPSTTFGRDVTYTRVVEKEKNGYKVYTYSNLDNGYMDVAGISNLASLNPTLRPYTSKELLRGKVLKLESYSLEAVPHLVHQVENYYNEDFNKSIGAHGYGPNQGLASVDGFPYAGFEYYLFTPFLKKSIETTFLDGGNIVQTHEASYDANNLLKTTKTSTSKNEVVETVYSYPYDYPLVNPYTEMVTKHMFSYPIEVIKYKDNKVVSSLLREYSKFGDIIALSKQHSLNLSNPLSSFTIATPTTGATLSIDPNYRLELTNTKYDILGNLLEQKEANGITTSFLWGYNNLYPVFLVKNAAHIDLELALGTSYLANLKSAYPSNTEVDSYSRILRSVYSLKDANVTSNIYKPLIGLTSQTDVKGMTTYYEYDAFQRLKTIRNQDNKILKSYTYHYKQP